MTSLPQDFLCSSSAPNTTSSSPHLMVSLNRRFSDSQLLKLSFSAAQEDKTYAKLHSHSTCSQALEHSLQNASLDTAGRQNIWRSDSTKCSLTSSVNTNTSSGMLKMDHTVHNRIEKQGERKSKKNASHESTKPLHSSTPDVRDGHAQFDYPDSARDFHIHEMSDSCSRTANQSEDGSRASSHLLNIFRNIVPDSYHHTRRRQNTKEIGLSRQHSIDSLMLNKKSMHTVTKEKKTSGKPIKISRSGHGAAMLISGADTLGGLPDDHDNHSRHFHFLSPSSALWHELGSAHGTLCRGSSCPVIFEGEESDEYLGENRHPFLSSSLDRGNHLSSTLESTDTFSESHTTSSEELEGCNPPRHGSQSVKSGHFVLGSDPLDSTDDFKDSESNLFQERSTFSAEINQKDQRQFRPSSREKANPSRRGSQVHDTRKPGSETQFLNKQAASSYQRHTSTVQRVSSEKNERRNGSISAQTSNDMSQKCLPVEELNKTALERRDSGSDSSMSSRGDGVESCNYLSDRSSDATSDKES